MNKLSGSFRLAVHGAFIAMMLNAGGAAIAQTPAADRFTLTDNDASVIDNTTGLIWKRCEEGRKWNGTTCRGVGRKYTWDEARAVASGEWRLPTIAELNTIKENVGPSEATINEKFFPNTTRGWFWTSSAGFRDDKGCSSNVSFKAYCPLRCHPIMSGKEELSFPPTFVRLVRGPQKTDTK
jgi:hypothetical protein